MMLPVKTVHKTIIIEKEGYLPQEVVVEEKTTVPLQSWAFENTINNIRKRFVNPRPKSYRDFNFNDKGGDY